MSLCCGIETYKEILDRLDEDKLREMINSSSLEVTDMTPPVINNWTVRSISAPPVWYQVQATDKTINYCSCDDFNRHRQNPCIHMYMVAKFQRLNSFNVKYALGTEHPSYPIERKLFIPYQSDLPVVEYVQNSIQSFLLKSVRKEPMPSYDEMIMTEMDKFGFLQEDRSDEDYRKMKFIRDWTGRFWRGPFRQYKFSFTPEELRQHIAFNEIPKDYLSKLIRKRGPDTYQMDDFIYHCGNNIPLICDGVIESCQCDDFEFGNRPCIHMFLLKRIRPDLRVMNMDDKEVNKPDCIFESQASVRRKRANKLSMEELKSMIVKVSPQSWLVKSLSTSNAYFLITCDLSGAMVSCKCPDFEERQLPCKHMYMLRRFNKHLIITRPDSDIEENIEGDEMTTNDEIENEEGMIVSVEEMQLSSIEEDEISDIATCNEQNENSRELMMTTNEEDCYNTNLSSKGITIKEEDEEVTFKQIMASAIKQNKAISPSAISKPPPPDFVPKIRRKGKGKQIETSSSMSHDISSKRQPSTTNDLLTEPSESSLLKGPILNKSNGLKIPHRRSFSQQKAGDIPNQRVDKYVAGIVKMMEKMPIKKETENKDFPLL
ncbi:uncharacterized protein BX663DRAFT_522950 [Cokeromyces recurvatus]|uniref:uncharacterized protein n=1 Tax=Cokeromyces recurvatus TaxID=90255 RepID=UPI00221E8359|nr:uncharacterized protein BX663DRAFT_522950 [Cokeromyces recurvatus]KAI7899043.1 hypothetical protein BX663DRAFT_522950 [Cokeromyces recurvatus]